VSKGPGAFRATPGVQAHHREQLQAGVEQLDPASPVFHAYERALDRTARVLTELARLGIDVVKLRGRQVELALGAIRAALDALDLTADQRARAQRTAADHLRGRGT
jgi:hypothetical protein